MQKTRNKNAITGFMLGLLVIIPAILLVTNTTINVKDSRAPYKTIATSSTWTQFYPAYGTTTGGEKISINATHVDRLHRNINFTVNETKMWYPYNLLTSWNSTSLAFCNLNITYPNGTKSFEVPMIQGQWNPVSKSWQPTLGTGIFYYNFVTNLSMPAGNYAIRAFPNNGIFFWRPPSYGFNFTKLAYVQVYNNNPIGTVTLNETTVYRNNTIRFNLSISDPETPYLQLIWNVTLVQGSTGKPMVNGTWQMGSAFNQSYFFNMSKSVLGSYYFVVNVYDGQGGHYNNTSASPFTVKDNPPIIHAVQFAPPLVDHSPQITRVNTLAFTVNLTDVDNPWYRASVYVVFQRQDYNYNYTSLNFTANKATYNFTGSMNITYNMLVANYSIIIMATDIDGGVAYYKPQVNSTIVVRDNAPTVNWVHINSQNLTNGLHFSSNQFMHVEVNATDIDQNLDYLVLQFINTENSKLMYTFNITFSAPARTIVAQLNISSTIFSTGVWNIVVYAKDFDGSFSSHTAGTIAIDPDTRDVTAYVIGAALLLIAGFVIGGMAVWRYANSKIKDIRRDMIIKGRGGKADQATGKKVVEKKMPPKAGKKSKYQ